MRAAREHPIEHLLHLGALAVAVLAVVAPGLTLLAVPAVLLSSALAVVSVRRVAVTR